MDTSDASMVQTRILRRRAEDKALHDLIKRHRMIGALGQTVTSEINLDHLFELIINQVIDLMNVETCSVFLYDSETDELWSMVSSDLKNNSIRISARCGISGWVYSHQTPRIVNEPYSDPRFFKGVDRKTGFRTRNILCIPLINRSKNCIGTLQVLNKKLGSFTEQDLEVLDSASHYVTIALENAKLYEDLKELDRVKEKVINHLSHELRTPLVIINSVFRLIRNRLPDNALVKIEKWLNRGTRNIERLSDLQLKIDDIMTHMKDSPNDNNDYQRDLLMDLIEEVEEDPGVNGLKKLKAYIKKIYSHSDIHEETLDVGSVLKDICDGVRSVINKREICLMQQFDKGISVFTDKTVFEKVCSGLLKNAIENTPDEGCVEISAKLNPDDLIIEFCDHGVGITVDNQKKIFSGFFPTQPIEAYRTKKPYEFNAGGAGVDLLRTKTFADRLNFVVGFESLRCPALLTPGNWCPGRISACQFIAEKSECMDRGGSTFRLCFPVISNKRYYKPPQKRILVPDRGGGKI